MADKNTALTHEVLGMKIDQLADAHKTTAKKVDEVSEQLVDPDTGLFSRVKDIDNAVKYNNEELRDAKQDIDKLVVSCTSLRDSYAVHDKVINAIELRAEDFENDMNTVVAQLNDSIQGLAKIAQTNQKFVDSGISRRKWTDRLIWFIVLGVLGMLGTMVKEKLFDEPEQAQRLERIEKNVTNNQRQSNRKKEEPKKRQKQSSSEKPKRLQR